MLLHRPPSAFRRRHARRRPRSSRYTTLIQRDAGAVLKPESAPGRSADARARATSGVGRSIASRQAATRSRCSCLHIVHFQFRVSVRRTPCVVHDIAQLQRVRRGGGQGAGAVQARVPRVGRHSTTCSLAVWDCARNLPCERQRNGMAKAAQSICTNPEEEQRDKYRAGMSS
jgi:hypothetical protein